MQSFAHETTRNVAVRMRKMAIVTAVENHCEWSLTASQVGYRSCDICEWSLTLGVNHASEFECILWQIIFRLALPLGRDK